METLDTYGPLWPDNDDETRNAVDHVLGGVTAARAETPRRDYRSHRAVGRQPPHERTPHISVASGVRARVAATASVQPMG
jgi:hypothetical protein